MKSKPLSFIFIFVALVLVGLFYFSHKVSSPSKTVETARAKVITPKTSGEKESEIETEASLKDSDMLETLIALNSTETLISSQIVDFNNDTNDDEIIVVRKAGSPYLWIVIGIFNKEKNSYDRLEEIKTNILSTKTFSYSTMDIIGDHSAALVYQGVEENGNYVMKIYLCETVKNENKLITIGDFSSDETIFIQQTERADAYELSLTKGESFSVWVYKSDAEDGIDNKTETGLNQLQEEYKWNAESKKYELSRTIKVTASHLAAAELSRIQDGTVETFASFLNGLWYKTDNADSKIRYLYFDYNSKEIIQLYDETQEVYEWEDSKLRHNGIYITTVNSDIVNLYRRFDIALSNVDEIKLTIRDQISLGITESTVWDGQYKKMSSESTFEDATSSDSLKTMLSELKKDKNWVCSEIQMKMHFSDYNYQLSSENDEKIDFSEKGVYAVSKNGNYLVLQFRSDSGTGFFAHNYAVSFGTKVITETVKRKKVEKTVSDMDTIILTPVKVTPSDCYVIEGRSFTFVRE